MSSNTAAQSKGTPLWRISKKFNFAAEKIIPDSFVFCVILMLVVFVLSLVLCGKGPLELLIAWWDGLSSQFTLAFQMGLMVIVCATCAQSPQVAKLLNKIAGLVNSRTAALIVLMIFGYVTSMLNWAFCTIVTPILAMHLAKRIKGLHFPMMVAGGYSCMILGQCLGPSATLYSNLATEGSSYAAIVGQTMSVADTCYNPMNIILFTVLAIVFILLVLFTQPGEHELVELGNIATQADVEPKSYRSTTKAETPAEKMNTFKPIMWVVGAFIFVYIIYSVATKGLLGALNMNLVIFLFVGINCFLFPEPHAWIEAHSNSMHLATDVMLQFPFYGAIMGMMYLDGGLGSVLVNAIVSIANAQTLPIFSFLSACVTNLFIPSQGGQFTVQGPLIVEAAKAIPGANLVNCLNAFVYGDECTNLLQPLYVIPALSVVGMKLKDVWGFMAFICMFWGGHHLPGSVLHPYVLVLIPRPPSLRFQFCTTFSVCANPSQAAKGEWPQGPPALPHAFRKEANGHALPSGPHRRKGSQSLALREIPVVPQTHKSPRNACSGAPGSLSFLLPFTV
ncbi:MAG: TIGR00366 family protein [Intestinimonas sp.]